MNNYKADCVIVGAGLAGMITALELLEQGKKVVLLDRDSRDKMGGLARLSFGGMFFVDTNIQRRAGIKDTVDIAMKDWLSVAEFDEEDELPRKWAEQYVHNCTPLVYEYLRKHKVSFFPVVHWVERGMFKRGNTYPRFHMVWGTGQGLSDTIRDHLLNHPKAATNMQLLFDHRVEEILTKGQTVVGVAGKGEQDGEIFEAYGETTVVATGGLGGDISQVKKNWYKGWGEPPEKILNGSHPFADGLVHKSVEQHNGKITHLDRTWPYAAGIHHPRPSKPDDGLSVVPPRSALWLSYEGRRFGPIPLVTAFDTRFMVEEICKEKKKYSWQVMNMKILTKEFAISGAESNEGFRDKNIFKVAQALLFGNKKLVKDMVDNCPDFVVANSVEELVEKMNALTGENDVDVNLVQEAITEYDAQIDRGEKYFNDEQLRRIRHLRSYSGDKLRTCKFQKIDDKKHYPLVAIREFILSRKTLGGIQTDLQGRVLDNDGQTMEGLYAVGEAAGFGGGNVHGKGSLEGTFLGSCVLTARVAAHDIAGKKLI